MNSSQNSKSSSVDTDPHDVPEEYKQLGWRKCYSNREKRYYYFNKYSQESIWSLDELFELVCLLIFFKH